MDARSVWVYRDDSSRRRGAEVLASVVSLVDRAARAGVGVRRAAAVDALVACGMLESSLADAREDGANAAARVTDIIASHVVGDVAAGIDGAAAILAAVPMPASLRTSTPEGFAYYALHPETYAHAMSTFAGRAGVLVVGIRSIGTTLSAIARAELARLRIPAQRITVRPTGDPYDRVLTLDGRDRERVVAACALGWDVAVVDEGPGISGSTFLATVDAVAAAGVPRERITIVCAHPPDAERLAARDAARRWKSVRTCVIAPEPRLPDILVGAVDVSGGAWREHLLGDRASWPAVFAQAERRKCLVDGRFAKFEGLGESGRAALSRAEALADRGFAPVPRNEGDGWVSYARGGRSLAWTDVDGRVLEHLARYCAERPRLCPTTVECMDLAPVIAKNLRVCIDRDDAPELRVERPAVVDGRMAPHEWLRTTDGGLLKSDGISHGDDHFFPGPTDIAWDLAGVVVEWNLDAGGVARLCEHYRRAAGHDVASRLGAWTRAYAVFRLAMTVLARASAAPTAEHGRLGRDLKRYRAVLDTRVAGDP